MEQFLLLGEEMINMRDIHRIKKDHTAHVHSIKIVFRHLRIIQLKFPDKVGRNAEFNIIIKEVREGKNIVEVRGGTIEEEDFYG